MPYIGRAAGLDPLGLKLAVIVLTLGGILILVRGLFKIKEEKAKTYTPIKDETET